MTQDSDSAERDAGSRPGDPGQALPPGNHPPGLAAIAGAIAEWTELPEITDEIYANRRRARDRAAADLD
jgi:hypothetical protein